MTFEGNIEFDAIIGEGCSIWGDDTHIGFPTQGQIEKIKKHNTFDNLGLYIGDNAIIRTGTVIYDGVRIGNNFKCGHKVLIREHTGIGHNVKIGTGTIIEGNTHIGSDTNIQSMVFIPTQSWIGDNVFIGPRVTFTNDKYPPTGKPKLMGAVVEDGAVIGAAAIILPGIKIGKNAFVAAGALVTKNVPDNMMAIGSPAKNVEKPDGCDKK